MVTICTASLTFNNSTFCPHTVFMCFVWISEQTAIISLYNINWLVFITETKCVFCAVGTVSLYIIQVNLSVWTLTDVTDDAQSPTDTCYCSVGSQRQVIKRDSTPELIDCRRWWNVYFFLGDAATCHHLVTLQTATFNSSTVIPRLTSDPANEFFG